MHLQSLAPNSYQFNYDCFQFSNDAAPAVWNGATALNDDGGGSIGYLALHEVTCKGNGVLREWRISRRNTVNKILVEYTCVDLLSSSEIQSYETNKINEADLSATLMAQHKVVCPSGELLKGWTYKRYPKTTFGALSFLNRFLGSGNQAQNQFTIKYQCQKVQNVVEVSQEQLDKEKQDAIDEAQRKQKEIDDKLAAQRLAEKQAEGAK
jgi:hypothetical protein